jgi:hypothetical protein
MDDLSIQIRLEGAGIYTIKLTNAGREFYDQNWQKYLEMYPNVEAPEPNKKPATRESEAGRKY